MIIRRIRAPRRLETAFEELQQVRREMERLFGAMGGATAGEPAGVFPPMNVTQDADNYYVRAELPGVKVGDIDLSAVRNMVSVSGKREIAVENANYHRREREGGSFSRSITLPSDVNSERIEARYADGILTLTLPKGEEAKPRHIRVKTS